MSEYEHDGIYFRCDEEIVFVDNHDQIINDLMMTFFLGVKSIE